MSRRNEGPKLKWRDDRGVFFITWTENGRTKVKSTGTANREEAEAAFGKFLSERGSQHRRRGPIDPADALVSDVLSDYMKERGPAIADPIRMGYAAEHLLDFFGENVVADVTPHTCGAYVNARGGSKGTARRDLGVLRAAINWAYKNGRLTRSVPVELPERPPARDRWLTRDEAARLIRACKTPQARLYMPLFILIGLYTGRRKEAILSLRWPQVDLDTGIIDFDIAGRDITNKRRGKVRIPDRLIAHLRRARRRGSDLGFVIHDNGARIGDIKKGFAAACMRAGLTDVSPHTLKHTAATWLMKAGVEIWQAAGFLSTSVQTIERVYAHHHPAFQKAAADALGGNLVRNGWRMDVSSRHVPAANVKKMLGNAR